MTRFTQNELLQERNSKIREISTKLNTHEGKEDIKL